MNSCRCGESHAQGVQCGWQSAEKPDFDAFGRVASLAVHDLRNLNNIVSMTVRNFRKRLDDPAFRQEAIETLEKTAAHMKHLIEKLYGGPTRNGLRRQPTTLGDLVHDALDLLAGAGRRAEVGATTVRGLDRALRCEAEVPEMQRVLFNLLLNAYDAIGDGGEVTITGLAGPSEGQVGLVIEDTGPGIPEAYLKHCLFCAFRSTKPGGLGVGLYHSKSIVEAHGGTIEVTNREGGRGARVTITLPGVSGEGNSAAPAWRRRSEWHVSP